MPNLKAIVGETVVARIPFLNEDELVMVRVIRLERAGVWVESQDFSEKMLQHLKMTTSSTTLVLFIPFDKIEFILAAVPIMSLSETSFGLIEE